MSDPVVASGTILTTWRNTVVRYTEREALARLRASWATFAKSLPAKVRDRLKADDTPLRSSATPWWQYLPGSDVVVAVVDPEAT